MMQSARLLRRPQRAAVLASKALCSTATPAAPDKAAVAKYARQRKVYTNQVNDLRKQWAQEFQKRNEANVQQQLVERVHIQLRQAERLRERRRVRAARAEEYKKEREQQYQRWREHVAAQQIVWTEKQKHKQQTYENMVKELQDESKVWVTRDNLDTLLTPEFFGDSCKTTGLQTRHSDFLRYTTRVYNAKRPFESDSNDESVGDDDHRSMTDRLEAMSITDQLEALASEYLAQRHQVSAFLEDIIDNGRDREHFHDITQALVDVMQRESSASAMFDDDDDDDVAAASWRDKGYYDEDVELGGVRKDRMQASKRLNAKLLRQEVSRTSDAEDDDVDTGDDVDGDGALLPEDVDEGVTKEDRGRKHKK